MKQRFMRFGGAILFATAIAACSGTNSIPVASGPATTPQMKAPIAVVADGKYHGVIQVTAADRARAAGFRLAGAPHITLTAFGHHKMPAATGFPLDMTCQTPSCPVMSASKAYNLYVTLDGKTCKTEACWGNPEEFLKALSGSTFAGIAQQYTKGAASAYTYGGSVAVTLKHPYSNTFYNEDLLTVLSAGANHFKGVGLNVQYHIFLPPGVDTCFDQYAQCYSPDNLNAFVFCAYHTAVYDSAIKQYIVFSVEPWQDATLTYAGHKVYGCQNQKVPKGTNRLNSGTASTLSHESFEAWSDPLPNTGWFNARYGQEIGDVCAYAFMTKFSGTGGSWWIQQEYSNTYHGCASIP